MLRIAPGLALPEDAVTQTFGILAKRGAGKSNAAAVMAEEMHKAGLPFVVVDPVGAWWGLRSSADGRHQGLPIPIFGGYHGDVPLEPSAGHLLADLVVNENLSAVLDVSAFETETPKRRFLADFAERLYTAKGKPGSDSPLHLFLEEADDYIPQRSKGEVARTLGAFERIVKRGRARGIGATMISQRSASINKDVLTQIETLIVLRIVSPTDRHPIEGWVHYHGQREEILSELSSLAPGEAWVWSPWLDLTKKVQFPRRRTYDSGATPDVKAKRTVATLADVDLGAIEASMKETIKRAKETDPRELQLRIRELEADLAKRSTETVVETVTQTEYVDVPVLTEDDRGAIAGLTTKLSDVLARVSPAPSRETQAVRVRSVGTEAGGDDGGRRAVRQRTPGRPVVSDPPAAGDIKLGKGERTVMGVLRQWPDGRTYNELAFLAGYSAGASTLGVILSNLRKAGYVEPGNQPVRLTTEGVVAAGGYELPPTGPELLDHWYRHPRMGKGERVVMDVLVDTYPRNLTHPELCDLAGYSPDASTMGVILSNLRKLGIVARGERRLSKEFAEAIV